LIVIDELSQQGASIRASAERAREMRFIVFIHGVRQLRDTFVVRRGRFNVERRLRSGFHRMHSHFTALTFISDGKSTHLTLSSLWLFTGMIGRTLIHGHDTGVDRARVSHPDQVWRQEPSSEAIDT
jgi:hypothetical protein